MKTLCLAVLLSLATATSLPAADLPTVTVEHLYYLQARADRVRKFKPDEMIEYCLAQKLGGTGFDYLYAQLANIRFELSKLLIISVADSTDPRVVSLTKTQDVYTRLLQEEAQRLQNGMVREGQIATDALQAISRAQSGR